MGWGAVLEAEVAELQQRVAAAKDAFEAAAAKLAEKRARLAECDRELATLAAEKSDLQTKLADSAAERKRHTHRHAVIDTYFSTLKSELVTGVLCESISALRAYPVASVRILDVWGSLGGPGPSFASKGATTDKKSNYVTISVSVAPATSLVLLPSNRISKTIRKCSLDVSTPPVTLLVHLRSSKCSGDAHSRSLLAGAGWAR